MHCSCSIGRGEAKHTNATMPQYLFAPPSMIEPLLWILCVWSAVRDTAGAERSLPRKCAARLPLNASALLGYWPTDLGLFQSSVDITPRCIAHHIFFYIPALSSNLTLPRAGVCRGFPSRFSVSAPRMDRWHLRVHLQAMFLHCSQSRPGSRSSDVRGSPRL